MNFYTSTNGDQWTDNSNWGTKEPLYRWYGIEVDGNGNVTEINLANNNLTGTLSGQLGNLGHLEVLNIRDNDVAGDIPPQLGNLSRLTILNLRNNDFEGEIPGELSQLSELTELWLDRNSLTGQLPEELSVLSKLSAFVFYANNIEGELPGWLGDLAELTSLNGWGNNLSGSIPAELGQLTKLENLSLYQNQLEGTIPPQLGNLTALVTLSISNNNLEGEIPGEILALPNIRTLNMRVNNFTGAISEEILKNTSLRNLYIWDNNFSSLPDLSSLNLLNMNVSNNRLSFEHIIPNLNAANSFTYAPQKQFGEESAMWVPETGQIELSFDYEDEDHIYQWYRNDEPILDAQSHSLAIESMTPEDTGSYRIQISHPDVADLTLESKDIHLGVFSHPKLSYPQDEAVLDTLQPEFVWKPEVGAEQYILMVSESAADFEAGLVFADTIDATVLSHTFEEQFLPNNTYYWRMSAVNENGATSWSEVREFKIESAVLPEPSLASPDHEAENVETDLVLSWNEVEYSDSYRVQVAEEVEFGNLVFDAEVSGLAFEVTGLRELTAYYWRVKAIGGDQNESNWSDIRSFSTKSLTSLTDHSALPGEVSLSQNYPNPFNPQTLIRFGMPEEGNVRLAVYDVLGREVAVLVNENRSAGWHEVRFDGSDRASGTYIFRLNASGVVKVRQMMLVK